MDYQVNDSCKSRENTHNFFSALVNFEQKVWQIFKQWQETKSLFSMLPLLRLLFVTNSFETRLTYSTRCFFVVCCTCTIVCTKKTHIQSNIIQTYSRTETYICAVPTPNNRQKHVFATPTIPFHSLEMMTISQTIDWFFHSLLVCLFHAWMWLRLWIVFVHCFTQTLCIENGISIGNHIIVVEYLWRCHCQNAPSLPLPHLSSNCWIHRKLSTESNVNCNFTVHFCSISPHPPNSNEFRTLVARYFVHADNNFALKQ